MPNPAIINEQSSKIKHFLGLVDIYLALGRPSIFTVEPDLGNVDYRPDAYTRLGEKPYLVELQRSTISTKRMQDKIKGFVETYRQGKHDARSLLIYTDHVYPLEIQPGFEIVQRQLEA